MSHYADFLFYFIPVINSGYHVGIAGNVQRSKLRDIEKNGVPTTRGIHFSKCPPCLVEETNNMHYKVLSNYTKTIGIGVYECWVVLTFL
jgi:hypothetical protein